MITMKNTTTDIFIGQKSYNSYILNTLYLMPIKNIGMLPWDVQIWLNT